jgi:hypothetical protein
MKKETNNNSKEDKNIETKQTENNSNNSREIPDLIGYETYTYNNTDK